jgi:glucose 1-dehydrogenase
MQRFTDFEVAVGDPAELGEGPRWDKASGTLLWVDIPRRSVHRYNPQTAVRLMKERGAGGRIVNVSSIHEDIAFLQYATYVTSKGGMRMLTRTICQELAPFGITINDIAPGAIATPINKRTLGDGELLQALEDQIPSGRLGEPDEVASVAVFLASDEAAYVTGSTYYVDGGMSRWNKGL